jgi:hypothetical protein
MNEEKPQSYLSKIQDSVVNELTGGVVWRFVRGILQLSAASSFGVVGTVASTIAFSGISLLRCHSRKQKFKENLLKVYSQELSAITGKTEKDLKLSDVEVAAHHSPTGKKNAIALELEALNKNINIDLKTSLTGIVAVAALATLAVNVIPATLLIGAGMMAASAFGTASNLVFTTAEHLAAHSNGGRAKYGFNAKLNEIVKQNQFKELPKEQVFDLLLTANPETEKQIKEKYSKAYSELPLQVKSSIVDEYEGKLGAKQLTGMINRGEMRVQELGFIAYGDSSGNKPVMLHKTEYTPAQKTLEHEHDAVTPEYSFVSRLEQQRMAEPELRTLH